MPKFNAEERRVIDIMVAALSIKRIPDPDIIDQVMKLANKKITRQTLYNVRQANVKKESFHWYRTMREGQIEYVHQFKERINEILFLQKKHHQIIDANEHNPQIQQTSLSELHRLSITLSNLFDVAPTIINGAITVPIAPETKGSTTAATTNIIV